MTDADHRRLGVELFNETWAYLDRTDRTPEDDLAMVGTSLASWHHWRQVGEPKNFSISDWQVSRVLAVLGEGSLARRFGEMSLRWATEHEMSPFYAAYAHEAIARAAALLDDTAARDQQIGLGREAAARVDDDADRAVVIADLDEIAKTA